MILEAIPFEDFTFLVFVFIFVKFVRPLHFNSFYFRCIRINIFMINFIYVTFRLRYTEVITFSFLFIVFSLNNK